MNAISRAALTGAVIADGFTGVTLHLFWTASPFYRKSDRDQDFDAQLQDSFAID
ncbi:MAG: hypothetical protein KME27_15080 [Lyngbya sp. HA4199-MV5]|jgi:hypothetical protein|nr:hypothetical protein [Lyngbya sp. HA4199-MV5]